MQSKLMQLYAHTHYVLALWGSKCPVPIGLIVLTARLPPRFQLQIENKLATISNVIDMLTGIIGPSESSPSPPPPPPASLEHVANNAAASTSGRGEEPGGRSKRDSRHDDDDDDDDSSPERLKTKALQSLKRNKGERLTDASAGVEPSVPGT